MAAMLMAVTVSAAMLPASAAAVQPGSARVPHDSNFGLLHTLLGIAGPSEAILRALTGEAELTSGSDGRMTFLLLGSDSRGGGVGLTDTIMLMSVESGRISAASIPRDTARIPNPAGGLFSGRINTILKQLRASSSSVGQALSKFEAVIENLVQIEIDYHAMIKFDGFQGLVEVADPITVRIGNAIRDGKFWDDPTRPSGVYFPAWSVKSYQLWAWQPNANPPLCNGLWKTLNTTSIPSEYWCRRAMPFVRSRKGANNSDFVRARRQQDFVIFARDKVLTMGSSGRSALLSRASQLVGSGDLYTNIPLTSANALQLYNLLNGATVRAQVVFKPTAYSSRIPGTTAYELNLTAVRNWANIYLS